MYLFLASVSVQFAVVGGWDFVFYLTEGPVFSGMWLLSAFHSLSESAHPRLMESDDVVLH